VGNLKRVTIGGLNEDLLSNEDTKKEPLKLIYESKDDKKHKKKKRHRTKSYLRNHGDKSS